MKEQFSIEGTNQYFENLDGTNYKKGYGHTVSPIDDQMTTQKDKLIDVHTDQTGPSWCLSKYAQGRMNKQTRYNINRIVKKRKSVLDGNMYFPKSDRKAYKEGTTIRGRHARRTAVSEIYMIELHLAILHYQSELGKELMSSSAQKYLQS